ncbi:MAG TPA: fumarylacetoacetate hydrolase family protein [Rhodanobacteraceae bacterium]|nr:fumarylacetoacetate hydrolase family protein [Rhodanobacteraceae bacterium]
MDYIFAPPAVPSLPILGRAERFAVRRVFCIGRNYADHAKEMGARVDRSQPVFFTKPADAVLADGADVPYPAATASLHHEVEWVVALAAGGRDIAVADANALLFGHGVGLDLTRRDLQAAAKAGGLPWDSAKGFDHSAPVSALRPVADGAPGPDSVLSLHVNGELRQRTRLDAMLWPIAEIVAELSKLFELKTGDLIFTGTPAGVAELRRGDRFHAQLAGIAELHGRIV